VRAYEKHVLHGQETVSIFITIYMRFLRIFYAKKTWDSALLQITTVSESVDGRVLKFSQTDSIESV